MNLKNIRKANGLNQIRFSKLLSVDQTTVSKWETGKATPRLDKMQAISKILNCDLSVVVNCFSEKP